MALKNQSIAEKEFIDKIKGFLVGMAIGDALGAVQEKLGKEKKQRIFGYITDFIVLNPYDKYYREPYSYTDDTQMALMTIDSFIENRKVDPSDIIEKLLRRKDQLKGPGVGTKLALENLARGYHETGQERPGNSPAFRCSPLGIIYYNRPKEINFDVKWITTITHTNPISIAAATFTAHCINYLLLNKDIDTKEILNYLYLKTKDIDKQFSNKIRKMESYSSVEEIGTSSNALESVPAAFYIFLKNKKNIEAGLLYAINCGGDTDSIGALVGAFYGTFYGIEALPKKWALKIKDYHLLMQKMEKLEEII